MEIEFFGANCFRVKTKKTTLIFDDNLEALGAKPVTKDSDALFYSQQSLKTDKAASKARLVIESPGEFEVGDISVKAVQTRAHMDEEGAHTTTVYQCMFNNKTVTILGHVHPDMRDDVLELAGGTDVLIVPVGGNGYTLDPVGAVSVVKKIEPSVVIASQYEESGLKFEVPATPLAEFHKVSGLTATEPADVYKVDKPDAELAASTHVIVLNTKKA